MTPRNLFNIILKVLGLLFIRDVLSYVIEAFATPLYFREYTTTMQAVLLLVITMLSIAVYAIIPYLLIFKTAYVIKKLKLEEGFDQEIIPLNMHRSTMLSICVIVVGGLIVATEIPNFCRQLFLYYELKTTAFTQTNPKTISNLVFSFIKIAIGAILIGNQRHIVNLIERQRKKHVIPEQENKH